MPFHQVGYLTPRRMVAWKCLSSTIDRTQSVREYGPVAYASRSSDFFPDHVGLGRIHSSPDEHEAVLWVCSAPRYRSAEGWIRAFPPTLTARMVVREVVRGDVIASWASRPSDADLRPPADQREFERWRRANSVRNPARRATFRITRGFALIARETGKCASITDAWKCVRTAIADRDLSEFLPQTDATTGLSRALGCPRLTRLSVEERSREIGFILSSPRRVKPSGIPYIQDLQELAEEARDKPVFISYRWNNKIKDVAKIARQLIGLGCPIWLDRLAIPGFESRPLWRLGSKQGPDDPSDDDLEQLLFRGIDTSALFLPLAAEDFFDPPLDRPKSDNWAQRELKHAVKRFEHRRMPRIQVVNLGNAPKGPAGPVGRWWHYRGNARKIAERVAGLLGKALK